MYTCVSCICMVMRMQHKVPRIERGLSTSKSVGNYLSACLPVFLSFCLPLFLSASLSLSLSLFYCLSVCLSVCVSVCRVCVRVCVCVSVCVRARVRDRERKKEKERERERESPKPKPNIAFSLRKAQAANIDGPTPQIASQKVPDPNHHHRRLSPARDRGRR